MSDFMRKAQRGFRVALYTACATLPLHAQQIAPSSSPEFLTTMGTKIFFSADDGIHGRELWVTDGEPGHARMLKDIWPGTRGSNPDKFLTLGNRVLFRAETPREDTVTGASLGNELWVSDGTAAGTALIMDVNPGGQTGLIDWMTTRDGIAYFEADVANHGRELWRTDGTATGTTIASEIGPGPDGSHPNQGGCDWLPDGRLVFIGFREAQNFVFVFDPRTGKSTSVFYVRDASRILKSVGGKVLFMTVDEQNGWEIWQTDGSETGTSILTDIHPGTGDSSPGEMVCVGEVAYFKARDLVHGAELWVTDGTQAGTKLVKDINPGAADSDPYKITACGPYVFFGAVGQNIGCEIWRTDGTEKGTILLKDINDGPEQSNPYMCFDLNGYLVFGATSSDYGVELWGSDGTPGGTRLIKDIFPGAAIERSGNPYHMTVLGSHAYFHATTLESGVELWRTDGTTDGTVLLDDIRKEDILNPSSAPHELTAMDGTLYFVANDNKHGNELWRTMDSEPAATMIRDIFPGVAGSNPHDLTAVNAVLYFGADDGTNGDELWRSDGTLKGTRLVHDYAPTSDHSGPKALTKFLDSLYFVAWRKEDGEELCMVKDTSIHRVFDIAPGPASSHPRDLVVVENRLYFRANDGVHGEELWVSGGSDYNTRMVYDLLPHTTASIGPAWLTPLERRLFFVASDGTRGLELWSVDAENTPPRIVHDIADANSVFPVVDLTAAGRSNTP